MGQIFRPFHGFGSFKPDYLWLNFVNHEAQMKVENGKVVIIHYEVRDQNDQLFETTLKDTPLAFVYGKSSVLPGLEDGIEGLEQGDEFNFQVQPQEAFGLKAKNKVFDVPRNCFDEPDVKVGNRYDVKSAGAGDTKRVTVLKVTDESVTVDENHPLAGIMLHFQGYIERIRVATANEKKSGIVDG